MDIKSIAKKIFSLSGGWKVQQFARHNKNLIDILKASTNFLHDDAGLIERAYCILNDITEKVRCEECNKYVRWYHRKYASFCSKACKDKSKKLREKTKQTNLNRYGVEYPKQSKQVREKEILNNIKKYGTEYPQQTEEIKIKIKNSFINKYGVDQPWTTTEIQEKRKQTNLKRYGVENPSQSEEIKQKKIQTTFKNYGVNHPLQSEEIKEKIKKTCLIVYGTEHPSQSEEIKQKKRKNSLYKYGVCNPSQKHIPKQILENLNNKHWFYHQHFILEKSLIQISKELSVNDSMVGCYFRNHGFETQYYHQGIYNEHYFTKYPEKKLEDSFLYIIHFYNDQESFIKIGITTITTKYRFKGNPYKMQILNEIPLPLYSAWLLEQELLKTFQKYQYKPDLYFGGHLECLLLESYENIIDFTNEMLS